MIKVGLIVAVELQAVYDFYGNPDEKIENAPFETLIYNNDKYQLIIANCGAGEIGAAAATQYLISQYKIDMLVNFGIVGALVENMDVVDVCVVEKVVHYDFDTSDYDNTPAGKYDRFPDVYVPTTKELIDKAHENGIICNVFYTDDPKRTIELLDLGVDTILTNDYLKIANVVKEYKNK